MSNLKKLNFVPTLLHRLEAACVTVACGAGYTGIQTRLVLMHPDIEVSPDLCQKRAATILFAFIGKVALLAPPQVIEKIEQDLSERYSSDQGLT